MYDSRALGNLHLEILNQIKSVISFSDFCASANTIEFAPDDGFLKRNLLLFKLTYPGYELEAGITNGMVFVRRNGMQQHSEQHIGQTRCHVAIQWDANSIGCGIAPWSENTNLMNQHMKPIRTPYTVPPREMIRKLRTENLLVNSSYQSADHLFLTVLDCLHLCEVDIRRYGGESFVWGKNGDPNKPHDEPIMSKFVASYLAAHGDARNFDVTCEPSAGSGNVDFWITGPVYAEGLAKIAIEAKKANNNDLAHGFSVQLPRYMSTLGASHGIFLTYWLKSDKYPNPSYATYTDLEINVLHPLPRHSGVRTVGLDLSNGPTPSRA